MRKYKQKREYYYINDKIHARELRVVGPEGENLGVLSHADAMKEAAKHELDLVLIARQASPQVARIVDFSKYKYEKSKAEAKSRKNKSGSTKQLKFKPNIDDHDLEIRINKARKFIEAGNNVKFTVPFYGRSIVHKDVGHEKMDIVWDKIQDIAEIDKDRKMVGKMLIMIVRPK